MKVGTENRKQIGVLAVLALVQALIDVVRRDH